ncbi:MAG TPA: transcriptional regulator NrdR [Thermoanaerobaculia bacterium]|nr:transcriptional regulator NrdR [Thermoanaerobaculia bacterium]
MRCREFARCDRRFTSYEKIELPTFHVVKRDERREPYEREKLMRGLQIACRKRPVPQAELERIADSIESAMADAGEREISSLALGTMVMDRLRDLDPVAYVRFASVYRRFEDVDAFVKELHRLR